jgi:putative ABC transport system substrate-binding protein
MVGKKNLVLIILSFVMSIVVLVGCGKSNAAEVKGNDVSKEKDEVISIGISQIIEHPALDSARKGFIDALESKGFKDGEKVSIDIQNAQGDIPTAQTIAENFVSQKKDMILAVATPAAQAAFNATKEIPILITAVTDPADAGLVQAWEKSGTNVIGTSDAAPIKKQFELIKKLVPNTKKVGIMFNTSETNSELQVTKAKEAAPDFDFEIITCGVTNTNEISQALDALVDKIDVLYVPTDNLMASSMPLVSSKCNDKKVPIIGAEKAHVELGALATEGIDYYKLGFQTGVMAVEVLEGKNPKDMAIETLKNTELVINNKAAEILNIDIPEDLKNKAVIVESGE